jgi:hypothetical protein
MKRLDTSLSSDDILDVEGDEEATDENEPEELNEELETERLEL